MYSCVFEDIERGEGISSPGRRNLIDMSHYPTAAAAAAAVIVLFAAASEVTHGYSVTVTKDSLISTINVR